VVFGKSQRFSTTEKTLSSINDFPRGIFKFTGERRGKQTVAVKAKPAKATEAVKKAAPKKAAKKVTPATKKK